MFLAGSHVFSMKPAINLDSHTRQKAAKAALISLRYILLTEMKLADMSGKTAKELGTESFIQKLKTYCDTDKTLNPSKTKDCKQFHSNTFHLFHWCFCPLRGQSHSPLGKAWKGCPPPHLHPSLFVALPHPRMLDTPSDTVGRRLKLKKISRRGACCLGPLSLTSSSRQTHPILVLPAVSMAAVFGRLFVGILMWMRTWWKTETSTSSCVNMRGL